MESLRRQGAPARAAAWLWLAAVAAALLFVLRQSSGGLPLETNVLALLPQTEHNRTAERAVHALADSLGNRAIFLVEHADAASARALARQFAANLESSAVFARVSAAAPRIDPELLTGFYAPHRFSLLSAADRAAMADGSYDAAARLARRMYAPFSAGVPTAPAGDPFGLLQSFLSALPLLQSSLSVEDGMLVAHAGTRTQVLVLAELQGSAYDPPVQERVSAAVAQAEAALQAAGAVLLRTGGVFYGQAARAGAEREMDWIGAGSLAGITALMWLLFRSLRPLLLSLATVAAGVVCAAAAVLAVHERMHLITLVFGASLIGEAVDYAIQYFAAHLDAGPGWEPRRGLARIFRGLLLALATSLIGYAALAAAPFPGISQIALFAFAGLAAAWLSVVLWLPLWVTQPTRRDAGRALAWPRRVLSRWQQARPRTALWVLAAGLLVCLPGWLQLFPDDDIRLLVARPAALVEQEYRIRAAAGMNAGGRFFLIEGADAESVLRQEEQLAARLRARAGAPGFIATSDFLPSAARQAENRALIARALPVEQGVALLEQAGLRAGALAQWRQDAGAAPAPLTLADWRASPLSVPFRHLLLDTPGGLASIVPLLGDAGDSGLAALAQDLAGVTLVDKAASVSALLGQYRGWIGLWLALATAIVYGVLCLRYRPRAAGAVLLPTLAGLGCALALYGYSGLPLTLFALMALLLVLGVGVNYAIFLVEAGAAAPAPFAGVLVSAATVLLSFGLLALSSLPALRQFGCMLTAGVACAVLAAPLAPLFGARA